MTELTSVARTDAANQHYVQVSVVTIGISIFYRPNAAVCQICITDYVVIPLLFLTLVVKGFFLYTIHSQEIHNVLLM